ncbi:hypothetical protein MSAN_00888600 [Mycena sanguinolenta]|uniref:Uncharacterized protein n=1 Tax=Mycena sanguinolenta TaxID=230812 RepID=A0A8H7D8M8_9AGAR|nr:hypothetical protein MSAN_00888600 [Mycena sanguinolenta]
MELFHVNKADSETLSLSEPIFDDPVTTIPLDLFEIAFLSSVRRAAEGVWERDIIVSDAEVGELPCLPARNASWINKYKSEGKKDARVRLAVNAFFTCGNKSAGPPVGLNGIASANTTHPIKKGKRTYPMLERLRRRRPARGVHREAHLHKVARRL